MHDEMLVLHPATRRMAQVGPNHSCFIRGGRAAALALALVSALTFAAPSGTPESRNVLWQIGRRDHNAAEFALAPDHWKQFREDGMFVVGESDAKRDWPYVQPGPVDGWAGGAPHTFSILFGLDAPPAEGECRLVGDLVDTQGRAAPKLSIKINGRSFEQALANGSGDAALNGRLANARSQQFTIAFPSALLRQGDNAIRITTTSGSWMLYDALALDTPGGAQLAPVAARTIIDGIQPIQALQSRGGVLVQPIEVTLRHFAAEADATVRIDGAEPVPLHLKRGANVAELFVPAVQRETQHNVSVEVAGKIVTSQWITLKPVRKLTLYVLPMSHFDIGYTEIQTAIEKKQVQNLIDAIAAARATANNPEGSRFVWNVEVLYAAELFLQRLNDEQRAEFFAAVKSGQIALNGMFLNELTGLCRPEELLRLFRYSTQLAARGGVTIDSAQISDVPGYTWGTVTAMAQAGIKYFSTAPNWFDRVGDILVQWQNRPFYWVSPSGKEKVLVWIPFKGYALSHIYRKLSPRLLTELQDDLDKVSYPYDIAYTRWSGHGDNAVPDPAICDFIKEWNATYAWPKLIISSTTEAFRALEQRYADKLPVVRGDWTPYWEDGAGSSARETAANRDTADRLAQAEALWAMRQPAPYPASRFDEAWRYVLLYSEHTWGASGSVWDSESQRTKEQWEIKQGYALHADRLSRELLAQALGPAKPTAHAAAEATATAFDIYNTASWPRTELVILPKELSAGRDRVLDARGGPVVSQRLSNGELAFVARDVPPFAAARYSLAAGSAYVDPNVSVSVRPAMLDNGLLTVRVDEATGGIVELHARGIDVNLAAKGAKDAAVNDYLFLRGNNLAELERNGRVKISVKESGPLVASLLIESPAPGCNQLTREVRLAAGFDHVELINVVDKQRAPLNPIPGDRSYAQKGGKESVNFAFAFNVPGGDLQIDLPLGAMRPSSEQIPGACKNWFTVGRWVDVANDRFGVTWATLDAPLIEVGGITATLLGSQRDPEVWRKKVEPTQTFYSWVMNNHWGTNYRAYQEGPTLFRYALRPHRASSPAEATRFATSLSQPLIVRRAGDTEPPSGAPRLRTSSTDVVATLKPSDEGRAMIVRLFGASGKDTDVTLNWSGPPPAEVWLSDTSEKPRQKAPASIAVPGWGVVTLRAEWRD